MFSEKATKFCEIFTLLFTCTKAELLQEGIIFPMHLFARAILLMVKLKNEETKAT